MKSPNTSTSKRSPAKLFFVGIIVILIALVVWGAYASNKAKPNYAEEAAKPLEAALVKAGAVKKCSAGDTGFGPDNKKPYYNATFETNLNKDDAIKLAEQVAGSEGYKLES